jgi:hypothetical protein
VIAAFTKYDQFKREINFKLEDQGLDTSTNPALLNDELERVFKEQYLANLRGSVQFIRLESKNFVHWLACTVLIPVPQECTGKTRSVLSLLKRLPMNSLAVALPLCS